MTQRTGACEFCRHLREGQATIAQNEQWFSKWDKYPVSRGHALVIAKRHGARFFELSCAEVLALHQMMQELHGIIRARHAPDGFNVGVNIGRPAGQTVPHLHVHIIPRYRGDVANPRGGVRNVMPGKGEPGP